MASVLGFKKVNPLDFRCYHWFMNNSGLSIIVRLLILPNPFSAFENGFLMNVVAEPILHGFTFLTVGIFYSSGEFPAGGSFLYLVFYIIHIGLIFLWASLGATVWIAAIILFVYYGGIFAVRFKMEY